MEVRVLSRIYQQVVKPSLTEAEKKERQQKGRPKHISGTQAGRKHSSRRRGQRVVRVFR